MVERKKPLDPLVGPLDSDNWDNIIAWLNNEFGRSSIGANRIKHYAIINGNFEIIINELMSGKYDIDLAINWLRRTRDWHFNEKLIEYVLDNIKTCNNKYVLEVCCAIFPLSAGSEKPIRAIKKLIAEHNVVDDFIISTKMNKAQFYSDLPEMYKLGVLI